MSREEADALIMQARVMMGWIKQEDLTPPPRPAGRSGEVEVEA